MRNLCLASHYSPASGKEHRYLFLFVSETCYIHQLRKLVAGLFLVIHWNLHGKMKRCHTSSAQIVPSTFHLLTLYLFELTWKHGNRVSTSYYREVDIHPNEGGIHKPSAAGLRRNEYEFSTSRKTFHPCFFFVCVGKWTPTVRNIFQHANLNYDGWLVTSTLNTYRPFIVFYKPFSNPYT
ncbi:hypothetical protein EDEG_00585 [Edhazardia aedis USNM 41457]|uniref:Uncharacterized protein n=1 Tax=Edhazardia aedis (strain USNM 41457) TaxID=1003232 RepID=J9DD10_EDHAE|nr:hypothetical protein EDEG_00585 [Edhazardia aedis USNM 41457]|eukprot:EJW05359.1 hypothetical protein EDEG_00585 [Edhazardia aedis USNM 41457]